MANADYNFENLSRFVLTADLSSSATSVAATHNGGSMGAPGVPFRALLHQPKYPNPADDSTAEVVDVTNWSGGTLTITRAQESTTGVAHSSGDYVTPIVSAEALNLAFEILQASGNDRFIQFKDAGGSGTDYNAGREDSGDRFRITHGSGMGGTVLCDSGTDGWTFKAPSAAIADGRIGEGALHFWVDEGNDDLTFRVRYSDGSYKTGKVELS